MITTNERAKEEAKRKFPSMYTTTASSRKRKWKKSATG
jgi:hypothetical protein